MNQAEREQTVAGLVHEYKRQIENGNKDHAAGMARVLDQLHLTLIEPGEPYEGEPGLCPDEGYHLSLDHQIYSGDFNVMRTLIRACRHEAGEDTREGNALKRTIMSAYIAYVFTDDSGVPGIEFHLGSVSGVSTVWKPGAKAAS